jgi:hypothetical protein
MKKLQILVLHALKGVKVPFTLQMYPECKGKTYKVSDKMFRLIKCEYKLFYASVSLLRRCDLLH